MKEEIIKMPKYRLSFPSLEFEAIHAKEAKLIALEHFKHNTIQIDFEEIEEDEDDV